MGNAGSNTNENEIQNNNINDSSPNEPDQETVAPRTGRDRNFKYDNTVVSGQYHLI